MKNFFVFGFAIYVSVCMVCGNASAKDAELQSQIDEAIKSGKRTLALPEGVVRLDTTLKIQNATNLVVSGPKTTLVFSMDRGTGIRLHNCSGVTLRGFTIDYDPLPFTQGTIVSKAEDGTWAEFEIHEGYPDLSDKYLVEHPHIFERDRVRWKEAAGDVYARKTVALSPRRGRIETSAKRQYLAAVETGDRIVLNRREGCAVRMDKCENMRVERLTILAAPGAAVIPRYMRGENYYSYDICPGPTPAGAKVPRLMSTCADGFNYAFARRGPVLENCHFSFMGDDSVNLHGFVFVVVQVISPTELLVGWPYTRESAEWVIAPGDNARLLKPTNYSVLGQSPIESFLYERQIPAGLLAHINAFWPRSPKARGGVFRMKLRAPLAAQVGDAMDIPAASAPNYRISNCEFRDHRARGARIQSPHGIIENNVFLRLKQVAISLNPEYVFWREAGWVEDVVVRGNRIEDCGLSPDTLRSTSPTLGAISIFGRKESLKSPEPFADCNRHITIEDNEIKNFPGAGIFVRCANDITIRNNKLSNVNYARRPDAGTEVGFDLRDPIDVRGVDRVVVEQR